MFYTNGLKCSLTTIKKKIPQFVKNLKQNKAKINERFSMKPILVYENEK